MNFLHSARSIVSMTTNYQRQLRSMLWPYLWGTFFLIVVPAGATAVIAFTRYSTLRPPTWVGLKNFSDLFANRYALYSLFNSLFFIAFAIPLRLLSAFFFALLLQHKERFFGFYRAAIYVPTIIPEAAYALVWLWIFNPVYGPLNLLLEALGLPTPAWLTDPVLARFAIVILSVFQMGEGFIVLLVGLQSIPRAFYEAAAIDGASRTQSFWRITFPLIAPWLLILFFRDLLVSLQNTFTPSYILTYGGPYYATTFIPLVVYELAFDFFELGMAAALLLLTYAATAVLILVVLIATGFHKGNPHV